jgi:hypothetical protein
MSSVGFCIICTLHFLHFCTLLSKVVIPLNVLTKMSSNGRQVMTIQDISASFQTILLLQCESTSDLTDVVKPGQVRGKCFAVRVASNPAYYHMIDKTNFNPSQPETLVITSVETLKEAFQQWAEEQEQIRSATANDAMLDESAVLQRLGKSRATLWRWNASGYLTCYKIGGKNCYKQSDVERIEKGLR